MRKRKRSYSCLGIYVHLQKLGDEKIMIYGVRRDSKLLSGISFKRRFLQIFLHVVFFLFGQISVYGATSVRVSLRNEKKENVRILVWVYMNIFTNWVMKK